MNNAPSEPAIAWTAAPLNDGDRAIAAPTFDYRHFSWRYREYSLSVPRAYKFFAGSRRPLAGRLGRK